MTLTDEERIQIIKALELGADWYEQGHVEMGDVMDNIEDNDIREAIAILERDQAPEVERLRGALINCYDDLYSLAYVHNKAFETAEGLRDFAESSYKRAKEAASLPPAAPEPTP
jgi:hypothetical protein